MFTEIARGWLNKADNKTNPKSPDYQPKITISKDNLAAIIAEIKKGNGLELKGAFWVQNGGFTLQIVQEDKPAVVASEPADVIDL